jgi:DNA-directed RNA polymerase subunit M/transcription elongation factor TFIIS
MNTAISFMKNSLGIVYCNGGRSVHSLDSVNPNHGPFASPYFLDKLHLNDLITHYIFTANSALDLNDIRNELCVVINTVIQQAKFLSQVTIFDFDSISKLIIRNYILRDQLIITNCVRSEELELRKNNQKIKKTFHLEVDTRFKMPCPKCKSRNTVSTEIQTRGSDEGMTHCLWCNACQKESRLGSH